VRTRVIAMLTSWCWHVEFVVLLLIASANRTQKFIQSCAGILFFSQIFISRVFEQGKERKILRDHPI
jgi:hypothetical protein